MHLKNFIGYQEWVYLYGLEWVSFAPLKMTLLRIAKGQNKKASFSTGGCACNQDFNDISPSKIPLSVTRNYSEPGNLGKSPLWWFSLSS